MNTKKELLQQQVNPKFGELARLWLYLYSQLKFLCYGPRFIHLKNLKNGSK
jgi:hypothetical protein